MEYVVQLPHQGPSLPETDQKLYSMHPYWLPQILLLYSLVPTTPGESCFDLLINYG